MTRRRVSGRIRSLGTLICVKAAGCADDDCGRGPFALTEEMTRWLWVSQIRLMRSSDSKGRWTSARQRATSGIGAFPQINVFRQGNDFAVVIEMPGVSKDDLGLEVRGNAIRFSGKKLIDYGGNASVHRRERVAGSFDRTITLPVQLDADRVTAEYRNGVLILSLPRAESDKPRAIKIG